MGTLLSDRLLTLTPSDLQPHPVTYLRSTELARRWGTTTGALAQLRYRGTGPEFVRIPGVGIRYALDVVERYERAGR
jgi:hypothetical protein